MRAAWLGARGPRTAAGKALSKQNDIVIWLHHYYAAFSHYSVFSLSISLFISPLMTCLLYIGNGHSHSDAPFKFLHIIGPSTSDSFGIDYCCTFARIGPLQYYFHFSKRTVSIDYVRYVLSDLSACVNCSLLIATSSRSGWFYGFLIFLATSVTRHSHPHPTKCSHIQIFDWNHCKPFIPFVDQLK